MRRIFLAIVIFVVSVWFASNSKAQDESEVIQGRLQKALQELKKEIRSCVKVENPGTIIGKVRCSRVRHSGDAVVFIEKVGDNSYEPPAEHGVVDQLNLTFVPHVIAVQSGSTVDFPNSDLVRHNVFSTPDCCNQFNLGTYNIGSSKSITFAESCEVPLLCNVHAEMSAYVVVLDNPYFAVTAKDGSFAINNVPPGTYMLKTWHECLRSEEVEIRVKGGQAAEANFILKKRK